MWYRVGAVRSMTGGRKTQPQLSYKLKEVRHATGPLAVTQVNVTLYSNIKNSLAARRKCLMFNILGTRFRSFG